MREYKDHVYSLYTSDIVKTMRDFIQHGNISCLNHCFRVSYTSYRYADYLNRKFGWKLDKRAIARGALLHDFFLYDWHIDGMPPKGRWFNPFKLHGFTHPGTALKNARKYFDLTPLEEDIIGNHMWPLTFLHIPRSRESFLVCYTDKVCALKETLYIVSHKDKNKEEN